MWSSSRTEINNTNSVILEVRAKSSLIGQKNKWKLHLNVLRSQLPDSAPSHGASNYEFARKRAAHLPRPQVRPGVRELAQGLRPVRAGTAPWFRG